MCIYVGALFSGCEKQLMLISDLLNGNFQIDTTLLRLANEIGLLASLSHTLAKLDNFLHNRCLFGKYLNYFLESGWRSGRVCSAFYSICFCTWRFCPSSHGVLAEDFWCDGGMTQKLPYWRQWKAVLYTGLCAGYAFVFAFGKYVLENNL